MLQCLMLSRCFARFPRFCEKKCANVLQVPLTPANTYVTAMPVVARNRSFVGQANAKLRNVRSATFPLYSKIDPVCIELNAGSEYDNRVAIIAQCTGYGQVVLWRRQNRDSSYLAPQSSRIEILKQKKDSQEGGLAPAPNSRDAKYNREEFQRKVAKVQRRRGLAISMRMKLFSVSFLCVLATLR